MKITRRGTSRDHGPATIEFKNVSYSYSPGDGLLHVKSRNVGDFRAEATHDYDVALTLKDLEQLVVAALGAIPHPAA